MIWCGVENPILPNSYLYSLNEDGAKIELAEFSLSNANRYCFSIDSAADRIDIHNPAFIKSVLGEFLIAPTWVLATQAHQGYSTKIQIKVLQGLLRKANWEILESTSEHYAIKSMNMDEEASIEPLNAEKTPWLIFFGNIDLNLIRENILNGEFSGFEKGHHICPKKSWIEKVSGMDLGFAYTQRDSKGDLALIVTCPWNLAKNLSELESTNRIKCFHGSEAEKIMNRGRS